MNNNALTNKFNYIRFELYFKKLIFLVKEYRIETFKPQKQIYGDNLV